MCPYGSRSATLVAEAKYKKSGRLLRQILCFLLVHLVLCVLKFRKIYHSGKIMLILESKQFLGSGERAPYHDAAI